MTSSGRIKAGFVLLFLLHISLPWNTRGQTTMNPIQVYTGNNTMVTNETSTNATSLQATANTMPTSVTTNLVSITGVMTIPSNMTMAGGSNGSDVLSCRLFSCNCTACYSTFLNTNATRCSAADRYCELRRDGDMLYSVRCASNCSTSCNSTSQTNCSVSCCGSETCLSSTLASLVNSTMSTMTTSLATTAITKVSTLSTTTPANNGKKCQNVTCNGDTCYQGNNNVVLCTPTLNYCMLKKTTSGTTVTWTAGCSTDCTKETVCSSTTSNCFLECCNATIVSSCLKLNGQVNMPSSAPPLGLHSPLLLLTTSLLLWILTTAMSV